MSRRPGSAGYFWRLMAVSPLRSALVFGGNAVWFVLPLLAGLVIRAFFETLSGHAGVGWNPWTLVALYFALRAGRGIWWVGVGALSEYHLAVVAFLLRRNLFRQLFRRVGFRIRTGPGEFLNRFRDDAEAASHPIFYATVGSAQLISIAAALWVLLSINVLLTVVAFLTPLLTFAIMRGMGKLIQRTHRRARESSERAAGLVTEIFANVLALQVAGAEASAVERFEDLSDVRRRSAVRSALTGAGTAALNNAAVGISLGVILLVAALQSNPVTVGDLALFATYVAFGDGVVGQMADWISTLMRSFRRADVSMDRLFELVMPADRGLLLDIAPPHLRGELPSVVAAEPAAGDEFRSLEIVGLSTRSTDSPHGIANVDLSVRRGEVVAITGRIGSGKTVLLETLLGLRPRTGGEIRWNGRRVSEPAEWFVPPRSGYVPQVPCVFSETVRENILLGYPAADPTLQRAIRAAVLEEDVARLEDGLDTTVGPRGVRLSGGQIQRVAAARAMVREPHLLVLDDLSSALDVETERTLWDRLLSTAGRPACLVVSHRHLVLQRADRIVVLNDGIVEDSGTLEELLSRCERMRSIWG